MKTFNYCTGVLATLCLLASAAAAETWQMPTPYPVASFHTVNINQFADDVEKASGGALKIEVHSAGSLFKHADIKNAIRSEQVPVGEFLLSRLANENALLEVDSLPFLATDYDQAMKLWQVSKPLVQEILGKQGLFVLFAVPWPPQALYTNKAIETVDDLRGIKLRAYNKTQEEFARLAHAVPTQVEVPDIPQAFATGRVDAMITSPSTGANSRAWEFLSHYYHTQAWLPKNVVVVNEKALARLDEASRNAVLQAAARAEERGWALSKAETEEKVAVLKDSGLKVENPSPELAVGLRELGEQLTNAWLKRAGPKGEAFMREFRARVTAER